MLYVCYSGLFVCVSYGSLQQHSRVQPGLQLDDGLPPHIQVADVAHQPFTQAVPDSTELRRRRRERKIKTIRRERVADRLRPTLLKPISDCVEG